MIQFEETLSPENWFRQSWEVFEASKVLYGVWPQAIQFEVRRGLSEVDSMKGPMLMFGLSAENALKDAFVYRSKPVLSRGKLDPKHLHKTAHHLADIAEKLNLDLPVVQLRLLGRLTIFVQWGKKYQSPLRKRQQKQAEGKIKLMYPSGCDLVEEPISEAICRGKAARREARLAP